MANTLIDLNGLSHYDSKIKTFIGNTYESKDNTIVKDSAYVHTDNNLTDAMVNKLNSLTNDTYYIGLFSDLTDRDAYSNSLSDGLWCSVLSDSNYSNAKTKYIYGNGQWIYAGNYNSTDEFTINDNATTETNVGWSANKLTTEISNLATKTELSTKSDTTHTHSNYVEASAIANFVTSTDVDSQIDTKLTDYSTTTQNNNKYLNATSLKEGDNISITNNGDNTLTISSLGGNGSNSIIKATYAELKDLKDNSKLIQGQRYLLTDYATKYYNSDSKKIKEYTVEPLILTAFSDDSFYPIVYSLDYPQDIITYNFDSNLCEDVTTSRNGFILQRFDTIMNIDFPNDWRNITWYRNGVYVKTFGSNCKNIKHNINLNSKLSNTVFGANCYNISFGTDCYDNTFGSDCYDISFKNECYNNTFGDECNTISFKNKCYNNTFGSECINNIFGNNIYNNTFNTGCQNSIFKNNCYDNIFSAHFNENIVNSCFAHKDLTSISSLFTDTYTKEIIRCSNYKYYRKRINIDGTITLTEIP